MKYNVKRKVAASHAEEVRNEDNLDQRADQAMAPDRKATLTSDGGSSPVARRAAPDGDGTAPPRSAAATLPVGPPATSSGRGRPRCAVHPEPAPAAAPFRGRECRRCRGR